MARKQKENGTMAIAERELTDETQAHDEDAPDSEKAKRERVDLETLDPNERVTLTIAVPAGMKLALIQAGERQNVSGTSYARDILAQHIEYTIPASFTERTRTSKWASEEERKEAYKQKAKSERDRVKMLLARLKENPELAAELGVPV